MSSLPTDLLVAKLPWWLGYHVVVLYAVFASLAPFLRRGQFAWPLAALGCLGLAWYHIYSFIYDDFIETSDGDVEHYLNNSDIFVNAYRAVTSDKFGWGWSWQLLAWTCTVCFRIWEAISARQEREAGSTKSSEGEAKVDEAMELPTPLQSVWLIVAGFFGAMSTCGFFLFGRISEKSSSLKSSASVPGHALFPTFLALATILATPTIPSDSTSYTYNLIAMHLLLAVPVVAPLFVREKRDRRNEGAILDVFAVYLLLALLTFGYHVYTSITLLYASYWNPAALVASLIRGFSLNHAQSSIASDAVFAAVATLLYIRANNPDKWTKQKVFWIANMVMLGPAVVLPMWFAMTRVELSKKVAEKPVDESKSPSRQEKRKVKKTG